MALLRGWFRIPWLILAIFVLMFFRICLVRKKESPGKFVKIDTLANFFLSFFFDFDID